MVEMFVVNEESTISIMHDLPDEEIINMIGSDYYPAVFRKSTYGIEYAEVNLNENTMTWAEATQSKYED